MCGIVGYIGKDNSLNILVKKLKDLEYRGYDSSGIAYFCNQKIKVVKSLGNISCLYKIINKKDFSNCGIGHTRWATNGCVTLDNAHPHISSDGKWCLVHNGIIENAESLKKELLDNRIKLKGETDTEVIVQLLSIQVGANVKDKIDKVCEKMEGSWALAIINLENPNIIYLAKNKNPLYYAKNKKEVLIASDPICFVGEMKEYFSLQDKGIVVLDKQKIEVYNKNLQPNKKFILYEKIEDVNKGKYKYFMLKEINETNKVLKDVCSYYEDISILSKINEAFLRDITNIKIIGCGTAYHSALIGSRYFEKKGIQCSAYIASEFRYSSPILDKSCLCIFVSQSGETADTIECIKMTKEKGCKNIAITNVLYSSLANLADIVLPICAGREVAVASTKAYSAQLAVLFLLSQYIFNIYSKELKSEFQNHIGLIRLIAEEINNLDCKNVKLIAKNLKNKREAFFLGRDLDYYTSLEASLKMKEISYINANAYPTGELKHGFLALIEEDSVVFVFSTNQELKDKTLNSINEVVSRGGNIILISPFESNIQGLKIKNFVKLPKLSCRNKDEVYPFLCAIFLQYLAYYTSIIKKLNPDQPRNLAKSVTVE